ncbi:hypothetical protein [Zoogloea sp.]|uniref:hypothetical protein n=1 Tax=Zoogloea sp. TaxID=49181 RepID=UPI001415F0F2|nr:MAG: hypothetical protein F9K15_12715 [Zoogloea sp.]
MNSTTYAIGGRDLSLAEPTPKRISAFLEVFGKQRLSELFLPAAEKVDEAGRQFGKIALDMTGDSATAAKVLTACLTEPVDEETAGGLPVDLISRVTMDFFLTLMLTYYGRGK